MIIIGKKILESFKRKHPQSKQPLVLWEKITSNSNYQYFSHLKETFPKADVHHLYTIFDIAGNKYRLITKIDYQAQVIMIKQVWTHAEYSMRKNQDILREGKL